ncbi:hypothetical protein CFP71_14830 [Amycolatopsis thailandensis]|uniref:Uncharacterized protein n=1 Tax=Amycolatopsis thailandensis TaxID=589330 RepID=A0A229SAZ5_9PSEU|nr:hypothetical protein CFP71_14830 [Amycolatopsis thailandensis]
MTHVCRCRLYAQGDPINRTDPTGAVTSGCAKAGITSIIGLIGTTATYVTSAATAGVTAGLGVGSTAATVTAISNTVINCT